jgi:hypothetical protein
VPVLVGHGEKLVDDSVGERVRMEPEREQPGVRRPVVVLFLLDPRVREVIDVGSTAPGPRKTR